LDFDFIARRVDFKHFLQKCRVRFYKRSGITGALSPACGDRPLLMAMDGGLLREGVASEVCYDADGADHAKRIPLNDVGFTSLFTVE
jgi:hypothetical protein